MPCLECGAERGHLLGCSRSAFQFGPPPSPPALAGGFERVSARAIDPRWIGAAVLVGALTLVHTPAAFPMKLFVGMWLHELGHAATSWLTGGFAVPLPWVTIGGEERSPWLVALWVLGLGLFIARRPSERRYSIALATIVGVGLLLPAEVRRTLIVFGGDAGAMILGAGLFALGVRLPAEHRLARGGLRYGWMVLGAVAHAVALQTWLAALRDPNEIPFGFIEGVGLSDASKLVEVHGWSVPRLVRSFVAVGLLSLGAMVAAVLRAPRANGPAAPDRAGITLR